MKGQSTIEFLGATLLFLIAIIGSLTLMSDQVPQFTDDVAQSTHNTEAYRLTNNMITKTGRHSFGTGGTNWEKNTSTISSTTQFGLASDYKVLDMQKIRNLSTTGENSFNYSQFRQLTDLDHTYHFNFTWMPIVETSKSFTRTMPPPSFDEPDDDPDYSSAENRINYGNFTVNGVEYSFLVVAFDGVYDTVYTSVGDRNFDKNDKQHVGDTITMGGNEFRIVKIQNRERRPGASVILSTHLNSFGPNPESADGETIKLNRYASVNPPGTDEEVVKMEVLSW